MFEFVSRWYNRAVDSLSDAMLGASNYMQSPAFNETAMDLADWVFPEGPGAVAESTTYAEAIYDQMHPPSDSWYGIFQPRVDQVERSTRYWMPFGERIAHMRSDANPFKGGPRVGPRVVRSGGAPVQASLLPTSNMSGFASAMHDVRVAMNNLGTDIRASLEGVKRKVGNLYDAATGQYSVPEPPPGPTGLGFVDSLTDKQRAVIRGSLVVLPGLKPTWLRRSMGAHLVFDALTGYADFRQPDRVAFQGLPALVEPYLAQIALAGSATAADMLEGAYSSIAEDREGG